MDLYSKFLQMKNLEVLNFERERCFAGNKVIADAFLTVKFNKISNVIIQSFLIEVQTSNNDYTKVLNKYNDKDVFDDVNNACGGYAPVLIYVDDIKHNMNGVAGPYQICQIDENLNDFPLILTRIHKLTGATLPKLYIKLVKPYHCSRFNSLIIKLLKIFSNLVIKLVTLSLVAHSI
jgi:hypothetical protein